MVVSLKGAKLIDFTGKAHAAQKYPQFSEDVIKAIREGGSNKVVVVIDTGFGFQQNAPHLVSDHLNFTGGNPLLGPNDPCGERFPVINDIYLTELPGKIISNLPKGILGGLPAGVMPSADETKKLRSLGAEFFSYNLAQTMIVAAHSGWKVVGIVLPNNVPFDSGLAAELQALLN